MAPKRILVRTPNWMGDHIMAKGFYENLRAFYCHSHIAWLMRENLVALGHEGLADELIILPEKARSGFGQIPFAKELRKAKFDLAISLPATFSSAVLFFLAKVPERVGFSKDGNDLFFTAYRTWGGRESGRHKSELYLELFEFLTGDKAKKSSGKTGSSGTKKILIAPGASIRLREWPYFEGLIDRIREKYPDYLISIVGAKESSAWHEKISKRSDSQIQDLVEKTSLKQLIEECHSAQLVVANDSGVAHVAATLARTKTLVLFGPGDPHYIAPEGDVLEARLTELPCSPCEKPYCSSPYGKKACLNQLKLEEVFALVERALVATS